MDRTEEIRKAIREKPENYELPENLTIRETGDPAMEILIKEDAEWYFEKLVQRSIKYFGQSRDEATNIQKGNLGYYSGYYDTETMIRVQKLFDCAHPVFGKAKDGLPTPEEAFEAGKKWAKESEGK